MENKFSPNQPLQCEKSWYSLLLLRLHGAFTSLSQTLTNAPAVQELRVGLHVLADATSNKRVYLGLMLLLVVTPMSGVGYQLFDKHVHVEGWYYVNNFYLFLVLCPYISVVTALTGIFFLFPENSKRAYFLIIPAGYHVGKILWLITVDSNEDFYRTVPSTFWLLGALAAFVWLFTSNYLMGLHYHLHDGFVARVAGVVELNELQIIDDDEAFKLLRKANQEYKAQKAKS